LPNSAKQCGTLFFIGPRRDGKTSILRAAEHELAQRGEMRLVTSHAHFD